ncbi:DUF4097 family beta strand repeat-containing protein [Cellulomonas composti]|uniref:Adhesin domain-containing protein n=1 Tax=Cellulomonas composti TaxID=266130 RepID=A0A511J7H7_9CELL|nr:DUF4097 family beta strand repeat-containing protein [Cellulomonas composti]GEL93945.1 hypothetical protein CCO02nite_06030 [Cellulomonas composti]
MTTAVQAPLPTTPPTTPPPADPRRSSLGRTLAWVGGAIGVVVILDASISFASLVARQEVSAQETLAAAATVELVADGDVTVTAAAPGSDEVVVDRSARFAFSDPTWVVQESADRLVVSYRCTWRNVSNCDTALDVTLPADTAVVVRTSNGAVRAEGIVGDVDVRTSNGAVEATGLGGDATLRTSNGRVTVEDVAGDVVAESSNGAVEVADARANIRATTSNGPVVVHGTGLPVALDIDTSNGREVVEGPTDPAADIHVYIRTSNGPVSYLGPRR